MNLFRPDVFWKKDTADLGITKAGSLKKSFRQIEPPHVGQAEVGPRQVGSPEVELAQVAGPELGISKIEPFGFLSRRLGAVVEGRRLLVSDQIGKFVIGHNKKQYNALETT